MGDPVNKTDTGWFAGWRFLIEEMHGEGTLPKDISFSDSVLAADAFNELMTRLSRSGFSNPLLESYARHLWMDSRARRVGLTLSEPPSVYFEVEDANQDSVRLIAAAHADVQKGEFRLPAVTSILELLKKEKIVIVFDFMRTGSQVREFIAPQLLKSAKEAGWRHDYLRFVSSQKEAARAETLGDEPEAETPAKQLDPLSFRHIDVITADGEDSVSGSFFRRREGQRLFILDFLDFTEWPEGEQTGQDSKAILDLFEKIERGLMRGNDDRAIFIVQGNIFSYRRKWDRLISYIRALKIAEGQEGPQKSFSSVMINPQIMNERQAADYLGVDPSDISLIASRIPLLPLTLRSINVFMKQNPGRSFEEIAYTLGRHIPRQEILIETGDTATQPYNTHLEKLPYAHHPKMGHDFHVIDENGMLSPPARTIPKSWSDYAAASGEITPPSAKHMTMVDHRRIFESSPTLQRAPAPDDHEALLRYLIINRDRIAVEYLYETGKLLPWEFTFPGAENFFKLQTLLEILGLKGDEIFRTFSFGLDYFFGRRDIVETPIRRHDTLESLLESSDMPLFTVPQSSRRLPKNLISRIFNAAKWFLGDPEVAVRSIYMADEIASIVFLIDDDIIERVPGRIAERLEAAGNNATINPRGARRTAVGLLKEMLDYYDGIKVQGVVLDNRTLEALYQIRRLYEWNSDALPTDSGGQGASSPTVSPSGATTMGSTVTGLAGANEVSGGAARNVGRTPHPARAIRAASRVRHPARSAQTALSRPITVPASLNIPVKAGI